MNIFKLLADLYWKFDFWLSDELKPAKEELKTLVATGKIRLYNKDDFIRLNDEEDNSPEHDYLLDNVYHTED
jgi:hypothetical protein